MAVGLAVGSAVGLAVGFTVGCTVGSGVVMGSAVGATVATGVGSAVGSGIASSGAEGVTIDVNVGVHVGEVVTEGEDIDGISEGVAQPIKRLIEQKNTNKREPIFVVCFMKTPPKIKKCAARTAHKNASSECCNTNFRQT